MMAALNARNTAGFALGCFPFLVAALVAATPAQNRFDFSRRAPASAAMTSPANPGAPASSTSHRNTFAVEPPRVAVASTIAAATADARGTATSVAASAARPNAFEVQPTTQTATAGAPATATTSSAPVLFATNWGGRSIRISRPAPAAAPAAPEGAAAGVVAPETRSERAAAPTAIRGAESRDPNSAQVGRPTNGGRDNQPEARLNYWDRRRWDPWYLYGWYWQAPYPTPYIEQGRGHRRGFGARASAYPTVAPGIRRG